MNFQLWWNMTEISLKHLTALLRKHRIQFRIDRIRSTFFPISSNTYSHRCSLLTKGLSFVTKNQMSSLRSPWGSKEMSLARWRHIPPIILELDSYIREGRFKTFLCSTAQKQQTQSIFMFRSAGFSHILNLRSSRDVFLAKSSISETETRNILVPLRMEHIIPHCILGGFLRRIPRFTSPWS